MRSVTTVSRILVGVRRNHIHQQWWPALVVSRGVHLKNITKNIQYISNEKLDLSIDMNTLKFKTPLARPMCIMPTWLLSKDKHLLKYAKLYLDLGFDVAAVKCSPWQVMVPVRGSQVLAGNLLKFLEANDGQEPLVVHGFSVGAYIWAELLVRALKDIERYQPVLDRVAAQVWDSPADVEEFPTGVSKAIFPDNKVLQKALFKCLTAHLSIFYNIATQHYLRATAVYREPPCRAPALFLVSKTDPIGTEERSLRARDAMVGIGIKCNFKSWESSPHVQHYSLHPEEYQDVLYQHLEEAGLLRRLKQAASY